MPFQKGHPPMGGRPKKKSTIIKDFVREHPYAVETLMNVLYEMGIKGDRESATYVIDRIKGKPKVTLGMDEEDREVLKAATVMKIFELVADRQKLLKEGGNALQITGSTQGSQSGVNAEEAEGIN